MINHGKREQVVVDIGKFVDGVRDVAGSAVERIGAGADALKDDFEDAVEKARVTGGVVVQTVKNGVIDGVDPRNGFGQSEADKAAFEAITKNLTWSGVGHTALDVIGLAPVVGEVADLGNAAWYAAEGNHTDAALSAAGAIPFAGWAATGGKLVRKGAKVAEAIDGARDTAKASNGATDAGKAVPDGGGGKKTDEPEPPKTEAGGGGSKPPKDPGDPNSPRNAEEPDPDDGQSIDPRDVHRDLRSAERAGHVWSKQEILAKPDNIFHQPGNDRWVYIRSNGDGTNSVVILEDRYFSYPGAPEPRDITTMDKLTDAQLEARLSDGRWAPDPGY